MKRRPSPPLPPARLAVVATVSMAILVVLATRLNASPLLHPRDTYTAYFVSAGGLQPGDEVQVAGVRVGSVDSVALDGQQVRVRFSVRKGLRLGSASDASVQIATVLGNVFLDVRSAGNGRLKTDDVIPASRTSVPYTLIDALSSTASSTSQLDQLALERALGQASSTMASVSKPQLVAALGGLDQLTGALAQRQNDVAQLVAAATSLTSTLANKSDELGQILSNGAVILNVLANRRQQIDDLLNHTVALTSQIQQLMASSGAHLNNVLGQLATVSKLFARDSAMLTASIDEMGRFSVNIANATGNGPWLDLYLPTGLIPDNMILACGVNPTPGCGS